jgi:hypothetical protein
LSLNKCAFKLHRRFRRTPTNRRTIAFSATTIADVRIMRISQNSSALSDVRRVIGGCEQRKMIAEALDALSVRRCLLHLIKVHAAGAGVTFKLDDRTVLTCGACVNVADQMQIFQCPAFAKHAEANVNRLAAPIREAGPTEQRQIITIRRMAHRNPSQTARNFEAMALSGQP